MERFRFHLGGPVRKGMPGFYTLNVDLPFDGIGSGRCEPIDGGSMTCYGDDSWTFA